MVARATCIIAGPGWPWQLDAPMRGATSSSTKTVMEPFSRTELVGEGPPPPPPLRCLEFYSGIGGWHLALCPPADRSPPRCEVVGAFELSPVANAVYAHNFASGPAPRQCNIEKLCAAELDKHAADLWTLSPPCQPFSRLGKRKDVEDHRTDSFSELLQTLRKLRKRPKLLLIENVQGFEQSEMRRRLVETLAGKLADNPLATDGDGLSIAGATAGGQECESGKREAGLGYQVEEFLLDPRQLGLPNARLRYYMIATLSPASDLRRTRSPLKSAVPRTEMPPLHDSDACAMEPAGEGEPALRVKPLASLLEPESNEAALFASHGLSETTLEKSGGCIDIVFRQSHHTCCFTKAYGAFCRGTGSILATHPDPTSVLGWSAEQFAQYCKKDVFGAHADPDAGGLEVPRDLETLRTLRLRYFTEREVLNLLGFPPWYSFPVGNNAAGRDGAGGVSRKQAYKLLGNSVSVPVLMRLVDYALSRME